MVCTKLSPFRRVATSYGKLLVNFIGFAKLAAIAIWLKSLDSNHNLGPGGGSKVQSKLV
jgi:hypothetical protein